MSNEELAVHIQQGRQEDVLPLWGGVQRFVYQQAARWCRAWRRPDDVQDLCQCGFLAMLEAVETFDPERGSFLTWYGYHLQKAFSEALSCRTEGQRREPLNAALSLDMPVGEDTDAVTLGDTLEGPDLIADADRVIYLEQLHAALEAELEQLPDDEAEILRASFYERESVKAIASERGLSEYKARSLKEHGLNDLRKPRAARRLR